MPICCGSRSGCGRCLRAVVPACGCGMCLCRLPAAEPPIANNRLSHPFLLPCVAIFIPANAIIGPVAVFEAAAFIASACAPASVAAAIFGLRSTAVFCISLIICFIFFRCLDRIHTKGNNLQYREVFPTAQTSS